FEFGVGAGWNREEMRNHGTAPRGRMAVLRERVEAMKVIWAEEEATYAGDHVAFERIWSEPKPVQRPHPPILVGGDGPTVLDRVLAFGDAWFPNYRRPQALFERVDGLRARADRHVEVQAIGLPADARDLERAQQAGLTRVEGLDVRLGSERQLYLVGHGVTTPRRVDGRSRSPTGLLAGRAMHRRALVSRASLSRTAPAPCRGVNGRRGPTHEESQRLVIGTRFRTVGQGGAVNSAHHGAATAIHDRHDHL